ncbi:MAG: hypothetical protein V4534_03010 [Myxococcota bacterium]
MLRNELLNIGLATCIGIFALFASERSQAAESVTINGNDWIELKAISGGFCDTFNQDPQPAVGYRETPDARVSTYDFNGAQAGIACTKGVYVSKIELGDIAGLAAVSSEGNLSFQTSVEPGVPFVPGKSIPLVFQSSPKAKGCIVQNSTRLKNGSSIGTSGSEIPAGQHTSLVQPFTGMGLGQTNACLVAFDLRMRDNEQVISNGSAASSRVYIKYTVQ